MTNEEAIEIVKEIRDKRNPYPDTVFIEPTDEQWKLFHEVLAKAGLNGTGCNGSMARRTWKVCCDDIIRRLEEEVEGDD